jgi:hypothetical protein
LKHTAPVEALRKADGRVNLSWGFNTKIQVAMGYADAAIEFAMGVVTYDILPGLYMRLRLALRFSISTGTNSLSGLSVEFLDVP